MFISQKYLSRRTLLRGLGASLALPLLDSMVPAQTPLAKTVAAPRTRLTCIEMVHGAAGSTLDGSVKHYWSPEKTGRDFEFTQTLEPLAPYRDYLTIISDTDLNPASGDWAVPQKEATALKRYGSVDDIAAMVAFVASPQASYITGANLTVDGGTNA